MIEIEVDVQPPATPLLVRVYTPDEYDLESMVATLIVSVGPGQKRTLTYRCPRWRKYVPFVQVGALELTGK